jgi:hypothetical protein
LITDDALLGPCKASQGTKQLFPGLWASLRHRDDEQCWSLSSLDRDGREPGENTEEATMSEMVVDDRSASDQPDFGSHSDWRLGFGVSATLIWLGLGFWYISTIVGWSEFVEQNAPSLGNFLEGAFALLTFLWLVVGFFLQQRQLMENTEAVRAQYTEMRRSAEQAGIQSQAILNNEMHIRQDLFIKTLETVKEQLRGIAGFLCLSYEQAVEGRVLGEESSEMLRQFSTGDRVALQPPCAHLLFREPRPSE